MLKKIRENVVVDKKEDAYVKYEWPLRNKWQWNSKMILSDKQYKNKLTKVEYLNLKREDKIQAP